MELKFFPLSSLKDGDQLVVTAGLYPATRRTYIFKKQFSVLTVNGYYAVSKDDLVKVGFTLLIYRKPNGWHITNPIQTITLNPPQQMGLQLTTGEQKEHALAS